MSSSQISNPLATYKILNAIDNFKNISENEMDYYVEMISIESDENISYRYRVYVNYIAGIKYVGELCSYDTADVFPGPLITTDQIPNTILSHGKLYATNGMPYYVEIQQNISKIYLVLHTDYLDNRLCISSKVMNIKNLGYTLESYLYYTQTHELKKEDPQVLPSEPNIFSSVYIQGLYTNNGRTTNGVYYIDHLPTKHVTEQRCYKIVGQTTTTE